MNKTLLALLVVGAAMTSAATPVTLQQAMTAAQQFAQLNGKHLLHNAANTTPQLVHQALSPSGLVDYYVFGHGTEDGFVIVSGDDRTMPVLGYSDHGTFDAHDIPNNVQWWLQQYQQQMQYLRSHPEAARARRVLTSSVEPLTTTQWKQSAPYNEEIPSTRFSLGSRRPLVGCVALAMAQTMKVHNWPTTGEGSHSYRCGTTYQGQTVETNYSANFGATTYQWSNMKNSYSSDASAIAVATLCYHCGVAVDMQYGVEASGAQIYDAAVALKTYFRYDKGLDLYLRDFYAADEWDDMLRADLDEGLPIIYGGSTQETQYAPPSGHCFVLDGYDTEGKFHINWGWGGDYDGWFATSLLDSGRSGCDFSNWQQAILGARPDRNGSSTGSSRPLTGYMIDFSTPVTSAHVGNDVSVKMEGVTFLGEGDLSTPWWGVHILSEDESRVVDAQYFVNAEGIAIGATYSADDAAAFTVPSDIADGTYHVRTMYSLDQDQTCQYFVRPATGAKYIKMIVANGQATFSDGGSEDPVTPDPIKGDVNGDGTVDVSDVNLVINIMLGKMVASDELQVASDVNGDGRVDVTDVNVIINIMLGKR